VDVFFYEAFQEESLELRRHLPATVKAGFTDRTIQEAGDARPPAGLISIRTQSVIPVAWAGELRGILARSTGYDHLLRCLAACGRTVPCGYLPLYCNRAVAEQALLLWIALLRKLPQQTASFASFQRDGLTGSECEGKTLAVVGVGNVGHQVVRIGLGLGMRALGVDIVERFDWVSYVPIDEAVAHADVIVCAMNLTGANVGYFGYGRLSRARPGTIFVNVARGEMSPPHDLLRLLEEERLGGVALDVYDHEQELAVALRAGAGSGGGGRCAGGSDPGTEIAATLNHEIAATLALAKLPNVILTPHNAFNTREAVDRKAEHAVRQVEHFLREGTFLWAVPGE
jgi:D-lactate dehydrogenase